MIPRNGLPIKNLPKKKSRPSLLGRLLLWLILFIAVFVGFGLLARIPKLQVVISKYENIVVTDTNEITQSLENYLDKRFLYPKSNRFWFSNKKAETYIMQSFPRINSVQVSSHRGKITIFGEERIGRYLWCGQEVLPVTLDTPCYFADDTGFIFDIAPYFSGTSYLRLYGGVYEDTTIGVQAFSNQVFDVYTELQERITQFGLKIQAIHILPEDQIEFILVSNKDMPDAPRIKYYLGNDTDIAIGNIEKALEQEAILLDIMTNYDRLEYLDVRFKNQFIYKFFDVFSQGQNTLGYENIPETATNIQETQELSSDSQE